MTNLIVIFERCRAFNQDLSSWNTSNIQSMGRIFNGCTNFNQDLSDWDMSSATDLHRMFNGTNLSVENYDKILNKWSQQSVNSNVNFNANGVNYSQVGEVGRNKLTSDYSWNITDSGLVNVVNLTAAQIKGQNYIVFNNSANTVVNLPSIFSLGNSNKTRKATILLVNTSSFILKVLPYDTNTINGANEFIINANKSSQFISIPKVGDYALWTAF